MKKLIFAAFAFAASTSSTFAAEAPSVIVLNSAETKKDNVQVSRAEVQMRLAELASFAKQLDAVGSVLDSKGCLWFITEMSGKPTIIRQLDVDGRPYCKSSK